MAGGGGNHGGGRKGGAGSPDPKGPRAWSCSACGCRGNFGWRTVCRECGKAPPQSPPWHAPLSYLAVAGAKVGKGGKPANTEAKIRELETKLKAAEQEKRKALSDLKRATGEPVEPPVEGPSLVEQLLAKRKALVDAFGEADEEGHLAKLDAQLVAARAARDKAKPLGQQVRDASAKAEKADKQVAAARDEVQLLQDKLRDAQRRFQEAQDAQAAARAVVIDLQGRLAAEGAAGGPREATDVDALSAMLSGAARTLGEEVPSEVSGYLARLGTKQSQLRAQPQEPPAPDASSGLAPAGVPPGGGGRAGASPAAEAGPGAHSAMELDEDGLPELDEEELRWVSGAAAAPDATTEPELHARYVACQSKAFEFLAKRRKRG